jgi:hypothetical protein
MQSTLVESPFATSQLYFSWAENEGWNPTAINEPAASTPATPVRRRPLGSHEPRPSQAVAPSDHLSFDAEQRIEKPVRIGTVMIKLLKKYGITDQEIADGLASYASKRQSSQVA